MQKIGRNFSCVFAVLDTCHSHQVFGLVCSLRQMFPFIKDDLRPIETHILKLCQFWAVFGNSAESNSRLESSDVCALVSFDRKAIETIQ